MREPRSIRTTVATRGLATLAEYVRRLPDNDPRVHVLDQVAVHPAGRDTFAPGEDTLRLSSRFCFDNGTTPPTGSDCLIFLDAIADQAEQEHLAILREGGTLPFDDGTA